MLGIRSNRGACTGAADRTSLPFIWKVCFPAILHACLPAILRACRQHIVRDGLEAIEKINESIGECDFYYIAPPQDIFRKILHKEAVEIIRENVETLEKLWREAA